MKRLNVETKKAILNLLLKTSIKRILEEKKSKIQENSCDECKQIIHDYIDSIA